MDKAHFLNLASLAKSKYQDRLLALATLWELVFPGDPPPSLIRPPNAASLINDSLPYLPDEFSKLDVERVIVETLGMDAPDRTYTTHLLNKMAECGKIIKKEVGKGRKPTLYAKPKPSEQDDEKAIDALSCLTSN